MTRLPVLDMDTCTPEQREVLQEWMDDRGQPHPPGVLWRMLALSPRTTRPLGKLGAFVRVGTSLDPVLQETGALIASRARGFQFEVDIHSRKLEALGIPAVNVLAAADGSSTGAGTTVDCVARLAYAMASPHEIPGDIVKAARDQLGDEHFVELSAVIAYFLMLGDLARLMRPDTPDDD